MVFPYRGRKPSSKIHFEIAFQVEKYRYENEQLGHLNKHCPMLQELSLVLL
jgi:hypothetical protein